MRLADDVAPGSTRTWRSSAQHCLQVLRRAVHDLVAHIQNYIWPAFEDQFKKGNVTYYAADEQYILTAPGSLRHFVAFYPSAEAMDKAVAASTARLVGMSADERKGYQDGLDRTSMADGVRDCLARVTHYAQK